MNFGNMAFGLGPRSSGGGAAFTPANLYAGGEKGDYYIFDAANTDASAADDPIGDATGLANGNDLTQGTAADKPLLKTGSGLSWALFDGVGDFLQTAAFSTQIDQPLTIIMGMEDLATGINVYFTGLTAAKRCQLFAGNSSSFNYLAGANKSFSNTRPFGPTVVTAIFNGASTSIRFDGVQKGSQDPGSNPLDGITIGTLYDGSNPSNIKVFSLIVIEGALSGDDLSNAESWTADKCGVTL